MGGSQSFWSGTLRGVVAGLACSVVSGTTPADDQPVEPPAIDPLAIDGRTFAGMRLPLEAGEGEIDLRATKGALWSEEPVFDASGRALSPVRRLLLTGDVRIRLGLHEFDAARAAVWLKRLNPPGAAPDPITYQVFVYFDRVGTADSDASISVAGNRLPVQGVLNTSRPVSLRLDLQSIGREDGPFLREAERALASHLRNLVSPGTGRPVEMDPEDRPSPGRAFVPDPGVGDVAGVRELMDTLPSISADAPVFARNGVLSFAPGNLAVTRGDDENVAIITDGVVAQYWDRSSNQTLQMSAQRAVVFLAPGPLADLSRVESGRVRGIYLEGDVVASDGEYTLRAPKVFYDLEAERALLLDAVFWTYDRRRRMPLYLRADMLRQESRTQFYAGRARISNTAFFKPHFSVGVSSVTISREQAGTAPDGTTEMSTIADARDLTLRAGDIPLLWVPRYKGDPSRIPLQSAGFSTSSGTGPVIQTTWDFFGLSGMESPSGLNVDLLLDGYWERGLGIGLDTSWGGDTHEGSLLTYTLPHDTGTDRVTNGREIERDGQFRGLLLGEHRWEINDSWSLFAEVAQISDENFVDALFEPLARNRREFTNDVYLRRRAENTIFAAEVKGGFNDFTPNQYLQQTPGYTVNRLPELSYHRIADDLLAEVAPGRLTWTSESRLGVLALAFTEPTAAEMGYTSTSLSQRAFGIDPNQSIADALRASGLNESAITRFDSRHELNAQIAAGPVVVSPFVVGRLTAYDDDFGNFQGSSTNQARLWGAVGATASTSLQRIYAGVDSRFLDLNRLRHIVEPSATIWYAATTVDRVELPVYDDRVEGINEGGSMRAGVTQTWQTQRGGPGRWRSVDVLRVTTDLVLTSDDSDDKSPIGRFFDYRPEESNLGEFIHADAVWQATDALALAGSTTFDLEASQQARTSAGFVLEHAQALRSFAELRFINPQDATYIDFGTAYEVSPLYSVGSLMTYDTDMSGFQRISVSLTRLFPNVRVGLSAAYNDIRDEASIGFIVQPVGIGRGLRVRGIGATSENARRSGLGG